MLVVVEMIVLEGTTLVVSVDVCAKSICIL